MQKAKKFYIYQNMWVIGEWVKEPGTLGHTSSDPCVTRLGQLSGSWWLSIKGSMANRLPGGQMKVLVDSLQLQGLWPSRLLCPWDSPGKNTGVDCYFFLQRIFLTQGGQIVRRYIQTAAFHLPSTENQSFGTTSLHGSWPRIFSLFLGHDTKEGCLNTCVWDGWVGEGVCSL